MECATSEWPGEAKPCLAPVRSLHRRYTRRRVGLVLQDMWLGVDSRRARQGAADSRRSASVLRERMTGPTESPESFVLAAGTRTLRMRTPRG